MKYSILTFLFIVLTFNMLAQTTVSLGTVCGTRYSNILYKSGTLTSYETQMCKLDIYVPKSGFTGSTPFPVIVYFHGGSLTGGDKSEGRVDWCKNFGFKFLEAGVAIVSVNYRLSPNVKWPVYLQDAGAAVAWAQKNVGNYGCDANNISVMGYSAGAYLTHMLCIDYQWLDNAGCDHTKIRGFIGLSGQTRSHWTIASDLGLTEAQLVAQKPYTMPMGNLKKIDRPLYIFCGSLDSPSTIADNLQYYNSLIAMGSTVYYYMVNGQDHTGMDASLGDTESASRTRILDFINNNKYVPNANIITNGTFSTTSNWKLEKYNGATANFTTSAGWGLLSSLNTTNDWYIQLSQAITIQNGEKYTIKFNAKALSARTIKIVVQQNVSPFTVYFTQSVSLTTASQAFSFTFNSSIASSNVKIAFLFGANSSNVYVANVEMLDNNLKSLIKHKSNPEINKTELKAYSESGNTIAINLNGFVANERLMIQLFNLNGKMVSQKSTYVEQDGSGKTSLTNYNFKTGVYILRAFGSSSIAQQKILIQK